MKNALNASNVLQNAVQNEQILKTVRGLSNDIINLLNQYPEKYDVFNFDLTGEVEVNKILNPERTKADCCNFWYKSYDPGFKVQFKLTDAHGFNNIYILKSNGATARATKVLEDDTEKQISLSTFLSNLGKYYISVLEYTEPEAVPDISYKDFKEMSTEEKMLFIDSVYKDLFNLVEKNKWFTVMKCFGSLDITTEDIFHDSYKWFAGISSFDGGHLVERCYFNGYGKTSRNCDYYLEYSYEDNQMYYYKTNDNTGNEIEISEKAFFNGLIRFKILFSEYLKNRIVLHLVKAV